MVQKMPSSLAGPITKFGFGVVPGSSTNFYGQGIYFTNSLPYCDRYYSDPMEKNVFLVSLVAPGNPFPVSEQPLSPQNLRGKSCFPGYQSHFTVVSQDPKTFGLIVDSEELISKGAAELIISDPSAALPFFILSTQKKTKDSQSLISMSKRKEWCHPSIPKTIGLFFSLQIPFPPFSPFLPLPS